MMELIGKEGGWALFEDEKTFPDGVVVIARYVVFLRAFPGEGSTECHENSTAVLLCELTVSSAFAGSNFSYLESSLLPLQLCVPFLPDSLGTI